MSRTRFSRSMCVPITLGICAALCLSMGLGSARAADEKRISFDFFSIATPHGWREEWMDEHGAYYTQQLPSTNTAKGCSLSVGTAYKGTGSLKSDLAAYEYSSLPGTFDSEPMKTFGFTNGWEAVTRVYRNRYSPTIQKLVILARKGDSTQWITWNFTGDQTCQQAARASSATLTLLPAKRRIRSDGTQLAIVDRTLEREPTRAERNDPNKYSSSCHAPSTTCIAPKVDRVGSACTCQNYRGVLEMGTIMP